MRAKTPKQRIESTLKSCKSFPNYQSLFQDRLLGLLDDF